MKSKLIFLFFVLILFAQFSFAEDVYKPYLHKASVPESPKVRLFGQYDTNLFPGAAAYSLAIEVPKGTNNLQPGLTVSYNSQSLKQKPGILGAGWFLTSSLIYRDINSTSDIASDDKYILSLEGNSYELVFGNDGIYHTEVEYHFKIQNFSNYWLLTKKDGTQYRFGYNNDSRLESNTGKSYALKWLLDQVSDTHNNKIYYSYLQNPFSNDSGAVYPSLIQYNNEQSRKIVFNYENFTRPDRRRSYEQGNIIEESSRLKEISVFASNALVRRYAFDYVTLNPALSSLSKISTYGADNSSLFYNLTFDYYASIGGSTKESSNWVPPVLFSNDAHWDYGVRLVDVNNDGYIDIVQGRETTSEKKVWLNDKNNNWTLSSWSLPEYISTGDWYDEGVRFADVNNDGFSDLLKARGGTRAVYLNNGTGWANSNWTLPIDFNNAGYSDLGVQPEDVNGDGKVDLVQGYQGAQGVYLNNGSGWSLSSWTIPSDFIDGTGLDSGARLVDINGDGLPDFIKGKDSTRNAWLNNASGWVNYSVWTPPMDFASSSKPDTGVRLIDVNGDGLVDIQEDFANGSSTERGAWLNTGRGWQLNNSWQSPEAFTLNGYNMGRRLADINGDGFADIIVSHQDSSAQYSWTKNFTLPYMLRMVVNEYGGVTLINYTTSTRYNNSENGYSGIGFNIFVVNNVTNNNSLTSSFGKVVSVGYNYSFGKYNYNKSEFRGFGLTTELKPDSVVKHYFLQDDPRRGKEYQTEVYNLSNGLYSRSVKDYEVVKDGSVYNLSLKSMADYLFDGKNYSKITNKSFVYDGYGNLLHQKEWGEVNVSGDERVSNYTYAINREYWIMDKVARSTIYDASGNKVKESKNYYDEKGLEGMGSKGELTKTEQWNNNGNNSFGYYAYDDFGNVIRQTDALGNTQKFNYDLTHTYPVSAINALGHVTAYDYNLSTGNLNYVEKNGIRTRYYYDTFGRIVKEVQPLDSFDLPSKKYNYSFDGTAPESVTVWLKTTANNSNRIIYYYDGFANLIQLKNDAEGQQIVKNIFYDGLGKVVAEQNPYFTEIGSDLSAVSSSDNYTNYTYDALDRVTYVRNPDGTSKNITFDQYNITDYDENGNKHMYTLDAFGRIVKVYEYNTNDVGVNETYITSYEYDVNDNLVKITDTLGNEFSFTYDSLNRKISMDDPDLGHWEYKYDGNGNLIRQTDARNYNITLTYDALNRIFTKNSADINYTFNYDKDYYGTLTNITSTNNLTHIYNYDDQLRVIKETRNISGNIFDTNLIYDSQNRIISKEGLSNLDFILNSQGKIQTIPGYITDSHYNPFGSILNRTYANNIQTTFTYNSNNNRLTSIYSSVQNLTYTYDSVGNILTINDAQNSRFHNLTYDNLDRLRTARIGSDRYVYSYDSLGRIMKTVTNNQSKKYLYNGNQTHAPSQILEGAAGIDVYGLKDSTNHSKNRTFEFYLVNDKETTLEGVNYSLNLGDGTTISNTSLNITDNLKVTVVHNYSHGGDYTINVSAQSPGSSDEQLLSSKFGTRANKLQALYTNISEKIFEFEAHNDIVENITNVSWNCSNGISSLYTTSLSNNQSLFDYLIFNYSTPGSKRLACTAQSSDGNESKSLAFTLLGQEVENYDVLATNASRRIVSAEVKNYFTSASTNISLTAENAAFSRIASISPNEKVFVFAEVNYSSDNTKTLSVALSSTNYSQSYVETFKTEGVAIENYQRATNASRQVILFELRNNWLNGTVNWNLSNPTLSNSSTLDYNRTIMVVVENNYAAQGNNKAEVNAWVSSFVDKVKDFFEIRPLKIEKMQTLSEGTAAVTELVVRNNLGSNQSINWKFDTGIENISSTAINLSDTIFVFIASNYSALGVYKTSAVVNSSAYNDTAIGVVVS